MNPLHLVTVEVSHESFERQAEEIVGKPRTDMTRAAILGLIDQIERTVWARGTGHVTTDECVTLIKLRGYLEQYR